MTTIVLPEAAPQISQGRCRSSSPLLVLLGVVLFGVFWSPAFFVPFWQDDYTFLLDARQAAQEGRPWFSSFSADSPVCFWRPVSVGVYWRFVEQVLAGNVLAAHVANLLLLLAATVSVGWLTAAFLRIRLPDADAAFGGLLAGFLYGIHGAHLLTVAWVAGAQESFVVLFCALALRFWLIAATTAGRRGNLAGTAVLACTALALLSKETAVVLPALEVVLILWIWPTHKPSRRIWLLMAMSIGLTGFWWFLHERLTLPPPAPYRMTWGLNIPRNALSLGLFSMNVPRESLRGMLVDRSIVAALWATACLALQAVGCVLLLRGARIGRWDILPLTAFAVVGLAPHLFLAWNCYEYYTSIALVGYALVVGMAACTTMFMRTAVLLLIAAAAISVDGNFLLDQPSLFARARWGQRQLEQIQSMRDANPEAFQGPIYARVEDDRKFQSFGVAGLAYTLNRRAEDIVVLGPGAPVPEAGCCMIVVPDEGDVRVKTHLDKKGRGPR